MAELVRGIQPEILFSHVENTASFFLKDTGPDTEFLQKLRGYHKRLGEKLSYFEYFELCLSAHYSTVATFVPTDVDNQIRQKLWNQPIEKKLSHEMAALTLVSRKWNFRPVTARFASHPEDKTRIVAGHQGEWFSVAVGAYSKHRDSDPELAKTVLAEIQKEIKEETELFAALQKARDGIGLLKAATAIAHNLGDLDRVIDQWSLPEDDPLRKAVYKLGHSGAHPLVQAGHLNKAFMASENHRHYPLREPKCLRRSADYLLPTGPFFDDWGKQLPKSLPVEELGEVVAALVEGFYKLSSPKIPLYGYTRAIAGIFQSISPARIYEQLSSKLSKSLQKGDLHQLIVVPQSTFESQIAKKALNFLKL